MIIGSRDLSMASWSKAAINTNMVLKDSIVNLGLQGQTFQSGVSGVSQPKTSTDSNDLKNFDEAFAKMMVNLRKASSTSESAEGAGVALLPIAAAANQDGTFSANSNELAANELATSAYQSPSSSEKTASELFKDYMNQSDAEKLREQLTGVSKEEYEKMSPEEQVSLDKRVEELTKEKGRAEQQAIKAKIDIAKAELV